MTLKAFPKINLYLKIIGKDSSAYHLLESRFVLVTSGVYDEIHIEAIDSSKDEICGAFGCDAESSSIALALRALRARYDFPRVRIEVQKRIPIGAGLGGGSADAGVVIRALMEEFGLGAGLANLDSRAVDSGAESGLESGAKSGGANLDSGALRGAESSADSSLDSGARKTRSMIAKEVGADVAFFVEGCECAEVEGRGEVITPLALARDDLREFEIYTPAIHCDTRAVYRQYAKMIESKEIAYSPKMRGKIDSGKVDSSKLDFSAFSNREILAIAQKQGDAPSVLNALNDLFLPASVLYPKLLDVKKELGEGWYFSGSGSSFFRPIMPESKSAPNASSKAESTRESKSTHNAPESTAKKARP